MNRLRINGLQAPSVTETLAFEGKSPCAAFERTFSFQLPKMIG